MRRKLMLVVLSVVLILAGSSTVFAEETVADRPDVKIYIDGKLGIYQYNPIENGGSILLPLREVLVKLGVPDDNSHIAWSDTDRSVTVNKDGTKFYVKVGSTKASINNAAAVLEAEPVNYKDRVFVPAGLVEKAFGRKVLWDSKSKSYIIGENPDPNIAQVIVGTAEEFVNELGSNKRILLKTGVYDLSAIKQVDNKDKTLTWVAIEDGKELNLSNISNLTIEGPTGERAEITVSPRFAEIMNFKFCKNITIKNIKAGHTPGEYICNAGVLHFEDSSDVTINNSELYGCGSVGLSTEGTSRLNCVDTVIDHCSLRAISLYESEEINFSGCKISSHEAYSNIAYVINSKGITFKECEMSDNNYFEWGFFEVVGKSDVLLDKCKITDNSQFKSGTWDAPAYFFKTLDYDGTSLSRITVKNTELSNNSCDYLFDNKDSVIFEDCTVKNNTWKE